MPGSEAANGELAPTASPVSTKPLSSSLTRSVSQSVFGAAPTMMKSARVGTVSSLPRAVLRIVTASRWSLPCSALTSAPYSIVIVGSASSRLDR